MDNSSDQSHDKYVNDLKKGLFYKNFTVDNETHQASISWTWIVPEKALSIDKVFTPSALRGQGIGGQLMKEFWKFVDQFNLQVKCLCPYAAHWVSKNSIPASKLLK